MIVYQKIMHLRGLPRRRIFLSIFFLLTLIPVLVSAQSQEDRIRSQALFNEGNSLMEKGDHQQAVQKYTEAISLTPKEHLPYLNRGVAYLSLSKMSEAMADADNAISLIGDKPSETAKLHAGLGYQIKGTIFQNSGDLKQAIDCFSKAIELVPANANFINSRGNIRQINKDYENARIDYLKAVELAPQNALFRTNLGVVLFRLNELESSLEQHSRALELNPNSESAHYSMANTLAAMKKYDEALEAYNKAISIKPKAEFFHARGRLHFSRNNFELSIEDNTRSIELNPAYSVAYADRATANSRLGKFKLAIPDARKAIETSGDSSAMRYGLAYFLYMDGQFSAALTEASKVVQSEPNWKAAYTLRSNIYAKLGNTAKMREDRAIAAKITDSGTPENIPFIFNMTVNVPEAEDN
ncbi:MAG: tetratricopeptide repeat protein [Acidobacteria bacterium]|nr:tetratricopeptide repeat protein [Acidobacteriota bacterium]